MNAASGDQRYRDGALRLARWLEGTLQGAAQPEHLQQYLNEFEFRHNYRELDDGQRLTIEVGDR